MKVIFKTNLDNYQTNCFPSNLTMPPSKGEKVLVTESFGSYFLSKKLPTRLEVVEVTWTNEGVVCELWYSPIDVELAKQNNINLF